ncbi:carbohydrate ABC transporter permease [Treponema sp. OttesenSCG-928-L16]|nr:carbohydrate ABC transporter permease [Treponema sp. OttesenSCG-928-L16]
MKHFHKMMARILLVLFLAGLSLWSVFPIYWNFVTSIKERADIFADIPQFRFTPVFDYWIKALVPGSNSVYRYLGNSLLIACGTMALTLAVSTMAAYAFSRYRFRFRASLLFLILATRLLPPISALIPVFMLTNTLGLMDTRTILVLITSTLNTPFSIWLLKTFFDSIPKELYEVSLVDGCTVPQSIRHIILPLVAPGLATAATFVFVQAWNEFTFAFIFSSTHARTLPVLIAQARGDDIFLWQDMATRTSILMIPAMLIGLYLQKHLVGGLTAGSIK